MRFEFATAARILFGAGTVGEAGSVAKQMATRALVVTGSTRERAGRLLAVLRTCDVDHEVLCIPGEPTVEMARAGAAVARENGCGLIIGCGGGSALDAAKAIAALQTNPGEPLDYLEVIGRGQSLTCAPTPMIAIPTTAGTGSEVTRNAVLRSAEHRVKVSMRSPLLLPRVAIVDPELTLDLPAGPTAATGLDALTQVIEPFVSHRANPLTDALCAEGMRCAARSLQRAVERGGDLSAREDMALASLLGGLALANAGLGAVHGFAAVIGGRYAAPHGALCARLLGPVLATNLAALRARLPGSQALDRFREMGRILTGAADARAEDALAWVERMCLDLRIAPLGDYGVTREVIPELAEKASAASSMRGNPIELRHEELMGILQQAM